MCTWNNGWNDSVLSDGEYFQGVHGNVHFTVIIFLFEHSPYIFITPCMLGK